nr:hypothetical protein [Meringosphaera mediterranea]
MKKPFKRIRAQKKKLSERIRKLRSRLPAHKQIQTKLESGLYFIPKQVFKRIPKSKKLNKFIRNNSQEDTKLYSIVQYGTPYLSLYVIKRALRIWPKRLHPMNSIPILWCGCWGLKHPFLQPYVRMGYYGYLTWHGLIILYGWQEMYLSLNPYQEPQATIRYLATPIYRFGLNIYPRVVGWTPAPTINLVWFVALEDLLDITANGISVFLIEKYKFNGVVRLYGNYQDAAYADLIIRKGRKGYKMLKKLMLAKYVMGYGPMSPGATGDPRGIRFDPEQEYNVIDDW